MVIGNDSADQSLSTRHMWFAFKVRFWVRADGGDHAVRCARSWQPEWCAAGVAVFDLLLLRSIHIKLWLCARPANVRQRRMTPADSRSYLEEFFRQFFLIQRTLKMQAKCPCKEIWTPNFGHTIRNRSSDMDDMQLQLITSGSSHCLSCLQRLVKLQARHFT